MGCLVALIAWSAPRVAMVLLAIFSDYLGTAFSTTFWPVLGFFVMPYTTIGYAFAWHHGNGSIQGFGLLVLILAVLCDLGCFGGADRERRRRRRRERRNPA